MSGRFVRASKYRHVHGEAASKRDGFNNLSRLLVKGEGAGLAVGGSFVAFPMQGGGGPVTVLARDKPMRLPAGHPSLNVHKGSVTDIAFSPFVSNIIATGSEDCRVGITALPEDGITENITLASERSSILSGHQKKIIGLDFHPTALVLSSFSGDNTVKVWDISASEELFSLQHPEVITDSKWNRNGSRLGTLCKDKQLRVYDPRAGEGAVQKTESFLGSKASKIFWADNLNLIGGTGFGRGSAREIKLWDPRAMDKPVKVHDVDQSAGIMWPHYDEDTSMLYIAGKGDGSISYFELTNSDDADAGLFGLSQYRDSESTKGVCWLPKRFCNASKCEVAVAYRLLRDWVMPISFQVPRKSDMFQDDIFPDTYAGVLTNTPDEWAGGKDTDPALVSMKPGADKPAAASAAAAAPAKSRAQLKDELAAAHAEIAELKAELAKLKA